MMMVASALHQIRIANDSIIAMCEQLRGVDLDKRPFENKRSIWEVLTHLASLYQADMMISNEATSTEMTEFYKRLRFRSLDDIIEGLTVGFEDLVSKYTQMSDEQLASYTTSYWGVRYTRYDWLLQMVGHVYHHRGQLHTMLSYENIPIRVRLFE